MADVPHDFAAGDRVAARNRPGFPDGTVLRVMDLGFLLVRWDSNMLETAHYTELMRVRPDSLTPG
jgi:hypothetical protein